MYLIVNLKEFKDLIIKTINKNLKNDVFLKLPLIIQLIFKNERNNQAIIE